jgi:hypothetical protein
LCFELWFERYEFCNIEAFSAIFRKQETGKRFLTQVELARAAVSGSGSLTGHQGSIVADKVSLPVREKGLKIETKGWASFATDGNRTHAARGIHGTNQC